MTPLQHATNSIKEGLPKFYFRPGYRRNFPYSRHQGGPRQISVLRKRPWYVKKRCCKFFSLRVTAWLRIVNPPTFSRKHYFIEKCFTQNYFHPEFPVKHLKKSIKNLAGMIWNSLAAGLWPVRQANCCHKYLWFIIPYKNINKKEPDKQERRE